MTTLPPARTPGVSPARQPGSVRSCAASASSPSYPRPISLKWSLNGAHGPSGSATGEGTDSHHHAARAHLQGHTAGLRGAKSPLVAQSAADPNHAATGAHPEPVRPAASAVQSSGTLTKTGESDLPRTDDTSDPKRRPQELPFYTPNPQSGSAVSRRTSSNAQPPTSLHYSIRDRTRQLSSVTRLLLSGRRIVGSR